MPIEDNTEIETDTTPPPGLKPVTEDFTLIVNQIKARDAAIQKAKDELNQVYKQVAQKLLTKLGTKMLDEYRILTDIPTVTGVLTEKVDYDPRPTGLTLIENIIKTSLQIVLDPDKKDVIYTTYCVQIPKEHPWAEKEDTVVEREILAIYEKMKELGFVFALDFPRTSRAPDCIVITARYYHNQKHFWLDEN